MTTPRLQRYSRSEWFGEQYFTKDEVDNWIKRNKLYLLNLDREGNPLPDKQLKNSKYERINISGGKDESCDAIRAFLGYSLEGGTRHYFAVEMHQFNRTPGVGVSKTLVCVKELDDNGNAGTLKCELFDMDNTAIVADGHKMKLCGVFVVETFAMSFQELVDEATV